MLELVELAELVEIIKLEKLFNLLYFFNSMFSLYFDPDFDHTDVASTIKIVFFQSLKSLNFLKYFCTCSFG